ncbi:hypothetical protein G9A89_011489 [Geosiphon pyriformis]|nr:hypothetical protein G9A89_011489 [Geosiphon pyriformis]
MCQVIGDRSFKVVTASNLKFPMIAKINTPPFSLPTSLFPELTSKKTDNTVTITPATKKGYLYGRVSSTKQKEDLERQKPYWNEKAEGYQKLWPPSVIDFGNLPSTSFNIHSSSFLQDSGFSSTIRPPTSMNSHKTFFPSTQSLSAACREGELPVFDESARIGEKRKGKAGAARPKRRKRQDTLNCTLLIKVYPGHSQRQLLKWWIGLS